MTAVLFADWRALAACRTADPEIFFPEGDEDAPAAAARIARALEACASCPVRPECLADAPAHGIWGGTTEGERDRLRRRDQRAAASERSAA